MLKNSAKRIYENRFKTFIVLVATAFTAVLLCGCSLFGRFGGAEVSFTRTRLALKVGDSYDLSEIIETDYVSYTLSVSDDDILSLDKRTVTALAAGSCTVTVTTDAYEDTLAVVVSLKQEDSFTVDAEGELIQTVGELSTVEFFPFATGKISRNNVYWYENGKPTKTALYDESYEFTPSGAGVTVVKAVCGKFSVEHTIRAYHAVDASVTYAGELVQSGSFTDIVFTANVQSNEANPADYIVWYCDGEIVSEGETAEFIYAPAAGRHTLSAEVNGKQVFSTEIAAIGAVTPDAPSVAYDNVYPHFYIVHNAVGKAAVEITSPDGTTTEYSQADSRYAPLFTENGFDAGEFIAVCAETNKRKSYTVRVRSLGDGDAITESGYSKPYSFVQLPSAAKNYLETQVLDGDLYITGAEEYVEIVEYYIYFRKKSGSKVRVSFDCYLAFALNGSVKDMWNDAFPIAATSGSYTDISVTRSGDTVHTSFYVDTVNAPSHDAVANKNRAKQLHAVLPHINYDPSKYRAADHIYPIDKIKRTTAVKYSDELYLAVENNTRPICAAGSAAQTAYALARDVLGKICTDDMTDMQKAHAIYDWIMWTVTYDDSAASATRDGESYGAYYLEGVFGDGKTAFDGVKYSPYAVCDGMSKAYSLMCNIEGIPCVRVIGTAGSSQSDAGGHAWNKVFVNDAWYVVDCTWGDSRANMRLDGKFQSEYELGLHDNLFLTDAEIADTHFEPYMNGESALEYAPKTTHRKYSVYKDMNYNGTDIDCFVSKRQNQLNRVREIAESFARSYTKKPSVYIPGGVNDGNYDIEYQGFDIGFENEITATDSEIEAAVSSAVKNVLGSGVTVKTYCMEKTAIVLIG